MNRAVAGIRPANPALNNHAIDEALPMILQWGESFDVGSDALTGDQRCRLQAK